MPNKVVVTGDLSYMSEDKVEEEKLANVIPAL